MQYSDKVNLIQELMHSKKYWVFRILDTEWINILAYYLYPLLPDESMVEGEDELLTAYHLVYDKDIFWFISKDFVPATKLARILGTNVGSLYKNKIIVLASLPIIGDKEEQSNVGYFGTC